MTCGCQSRSSSVQKRAAAPAQRAYVPMALPHEVLPGESCIFCAQKHLSVAYTEAVAGSSLPVIAGELELARRHTLAEYKDIALDIASLEYDWLTRTAVNFGRFSELLSAVDRRASETPETKDRVIDPDVMSVVVNPHNPMIGELRLYSAYRLAFEVGYMMSNKAMIIGDLVFAREGLVKYDPMIQDMLRDLRHRIQNLRGSDISSEWPAVCGRVDKFISAHLPEYLGTYADGLRTFLKLDT